MKVIDIDKYENNQINTAIALGNFDGVHIGHQELISSLVNISNTNKLLSGILLFENHTKNFLESNNIKLLTSNQVKLALFKKLDIDIIFKARFTNDLRLLSPEKFVKNILVDILNVKNIVVGFDYRFGYKASGDINLLKDLGDKYGFHVNIIEPQYIDKRLISSTAIRNYIELGNIEEANLMLGREYSIRGRILKKTKSDITPTFYMVNIEIDPEFMLPKTGNYLTSCLSGDEEFLSISSIVHGLESNKTSIEMYVNKLSPIDFNKTIIIKFIKLMDKYKTVENISKLEEETFKHIKSKY